MKKEIDRSPSSFYCPHAVRCPGCRHHVRPPAVDELIRFFSPWKIPVPYMARQETGWRSRAKLAVRATHAGCAVGLFQERSHEVVDITECLMHTPQLNRALDVCMSYVRNTKAASFYNETTHTGALRYLFLSEETSSSKVAIVFVLNLSEKSKEVQSWVEIAKTLFTAHPNLFHSFWLNFQPKVSNTISGQVCHHVIGDVYQWERIGDVELPFHPLHFRQANFPLFASLLHDLEAHIPLGTHIIDLFGGMGAIGLSLCHKAKGVECVEIDPSAYTSFQEAVKKLPSHLQSRVSFHCLSCNSEEVRNILGKAETIIVDPPRKGLSSSLIEDISTSPVSTLVYISCCAETLMANLSALIPLGWKPVFAKTYQFFPRTDHIESLVILLR